MKDFLQDRLRKLEQLGAPVAIRKRMFEDYLTAELIFDDEGGLAVAFDAVDDDTNQAQILGWALVQLEAMGADFSANYDDDEDNPVSFTPMIGGVGVQGKGQSFIAAVLDAYVGTLEREKTIYGS